MDNEKEFIEMLKAVKVRNNVIPTMALNDPP